MDIIVVVIYVVLGMKAIRYVKVNIFGVVAEYTNDLAQHLLQKIISAALFGWLAIPVALIHWFFVGHK